MTLQTNIAPVNLLALVVAAMALSLAATARAQPRQVLVPSGSFHSVMPEVEGEPIRVASFYLDVTAVTNEQYEVFTAKHEQWQRGEVPAVFASSDYLKHWAASGPDYEVIGKNRPVTHVSWFAANAYCQSVGGRLPTLNEWEYSAQLMDFDSQSSVSQFAARLMSWYSSVDTKNSAAVGSTGIENRLGVKDQFGLIMEWVQDFKPPVADDLSLDCGTVGRMQQWGNAYSYAASIRYITRMSYSPTTATATMGFRCAYNMEQEPETATIAQ
ncbi:formylglycine-generating enzyme family protein [Aliifodinibius sp. S!AR15-10]|uniref:formylglycine-generating enzyme family protein n=1 Tax=Aliifodinibius sp. S!AR15-10 TaxID=2950437 RepID=UPI00285D6EAB|nr:formylglycine-generating enzyme family protein [Aliifodinibius sp. S!AR15-10]MDR8390758.1 formylglycine-generating enzyme family protein [Aliifodinibius sp. S!AR15-10]